MNRNPEEGIGRKKYPPLAMTKERVAAMFPIEKELRIPTMDKPLILESACPGWQIGGSRFPAVPISIADQIKEQSESVKAGAIAIHVHPRDPKTGDAQTNPKLLKEVLDGIFANVGDCVTLSHTWYPVPDAEVDYVVDTEELLEMGEGNKYAQGSIVLPIGVVTRGAARSFSTLKATAEGIKWLEAHDVKPIYDCLHTNAHLAFKEHLFDRGVSTWKPYVMNVCLGKHESTVVHQDPWSYLQIIGNVNMVKATIPESIISIHPGGRNWLPVATMGILMGADLIRVGIEDCYWLYPHKDEVIKKNSDVVKMVVELATILGRRVVTDANEARKILGMKLTSKL